MPESQSLLGASKRQRIEKNSRGDLNIFFLWGPEISGETGTPKDTMF